MPIADNSTDSDLVFDVNSTKDERDFSTNGVCSARQAVGGPCTLRAEISEANGNVPCTVSMPSPAWDVSFTAPTTGAKDAQWAN